jgi:type II secretory pathway predicted ATPase ExeA
MALYLEHFGLKEPPFRITPHTDFFFDGAERGATLEGLIYAILHDEGIVKVSGEVGSGKTMLCRVLMERLPAHVDTIYLATPSLARDEIIHAIADDLQLQLSPDRTTVALRELQEHLIRLYGEGRRVVILIDEAHVMPDETLEQVRLLSNLESSRHKLLQIVLFGQPELDQTLAKNSLRQLRDRITHSFRTRPLSTPEVAHYLSFRMRAAGYRGPDVFTARAVAQLARAAAGLTRRINILADKALLAAFSENTHAVTDRHVRAAVRDSEFTPVAGPLRSAVWFGIAALVAGLAIGALLHWAWTTRPDPPIQAQAAVPVKPPAPVEPPPPPSLLSEAQAMRIEAYPTEGQRLLTERVAATREALAKVPDQHYSIELFATDNSDPARMERFLLRARDMVPLDQVLVIPVPVGGRYRLRIVYGAFATREEAAAARSRLPPRYQQAFRTSIHSFEDLRGQI